MRVRFSRLNFVNLDINRSALEDYGYSYGAKNNATEHDYSRNRLEIGFESTVYAMKITGHCTFYYVREPIKKRITHFAAPCFDIVDNKISQYWYVRREALPKREGRRPMPPRDNTVFAIKEWTEEPMFLNNLVDEREREMRIMNRMAKLMDEEFESDLSS